MQLIDPDLAQPLRASTEGRGTAMLLARAGDRRFPRKRIGQYADGALVRLQCSFEIRAWKDRRRVPVASHAQPDELRRPGQPAEPVVGCAACSTIVLVAVG